MEQVVQFAFDEQWKALRAYCAERDIRFIGDVAIFVNFDSADVWTHPEIFELKKDLTPIRVAGVPPDYFSATGQRWGNPIYKWDVAAKAGALTGGSTVCAEPTSCTTLSAWTIFAALKPTGPFPPRTRPRFTVSGSKHRAPLSLPRSRKNYGDLPIIAEDLGMITREVDALREQFGFPGMRVLQFGFSDRPAHNYLPHRYVTNTVVYTGTHDNDTTLGWWEHGVTETERQAVYVYLNPAQNDVVWTLIRAASKLGGGRLHFPRAGRTGAGVGSAHEHALDAGE